LGCGTPGAKVYVAVFYVAYLKYNKSLDNGGQNARYFYVPSANLVVGTWHEGAGQCVRAELRSYALSPILATAKIGLPFRGEAPRNAPPPVFFA